MNEITRRVTAGAELLDKKMPGWALKINLKRFNIEDSKYCPLGQLYGDYSEGIDKLTLPRYKDRFDYGYSFHENNEITQLNKEWRKQIKLRKQAVTTQSCPTYIFSFFVESGWCKLCK